MTDTRRFRGSSTLDEKMMFPAAATQWTGYGTATANYYKPAAVDGKYSTEKSNKHIGHVGAVFTLIAFSIISVKLFVLLSKYSADLFLAFQ